MSPAAFSRSSTVDYTKGVPTPPAEKASACRGVRTAAKTSASPPLAHGTMVLKRRPPATPASAATPLDLPPCPPAKAHAYANVEHDTHTRQDSQSRQCQLLRQPRSQCQQPRLLHASPPPKHLRQRQAVSQRKHISQHPHRCTQPRTPMDQPKFSLIQQELASCATKEQSHPPCLSSGNLIPRPRLSCHQT